MCDFSTAAMSGQFDIENGAWWDEQLEKTGIQASMLPTPKRTGTYVGVTTTDAEYLTGLPPGISFSLGALDHHAAAIGAGISSNGYLCESTGTVLSCVDETDCYIPRQGVFVAPGLHPGRYFRMMFDDNGATSLEWYQKNYAPEYSIQELLEMAAQVVPGCEGLTAFPCADRYPELSGFDIDNRNCYGHGHFIRALLESTARSLHSIVTAMHKDRPVKGIVSSGGGSRSKLWVAIKSDLINVPFFIPECTELACFGAAMIGNRDAGYPRVSIAKNIRT